MNNKIISFKDLLAAQITDEPEEILLRRKRRKTEARQQPVLHDAEVGDEIDFELRKGTWVRAIVTKFIKSKQGSPVFVSAVVKTVDSKREYTLDMDHPTKWPSLSEQYGPDFEKDIRGAMKNYKISKSGWGAIKKHNVEVIVVWDKKTEPEIVKKLERAGLKVRLSHTSLNPTRKPGDAYILFDRARVPVVESVITEAKEFHISDGSVYGAKVTDADRKKFTADLKRAGGKVVDVTDKGVIVSFQHDWDATAFKRSLRGSKQFSVDESSRLMRSTEQTDVNEALIISQRAKAHRRFQRLKSKIAHIRDNKS